MTNAINAKGDVLSERELDCVSAGGIKGALQGVCTKGTSGGQNDPAQMFQQILQQLTQGPG
ncbi:MAG: hypothetical protein K2X57_25250 [Xanthobacteraceae bacterium]|nr:hypothetical protein [Xanthobacteraceae bacterium]